MSTKHYSLVSKKFLEHIVGPDHPHLKGNRNEVRRQVILALSSELHVYIYVTSSRWTLKINVHFYCFPRLLHYVLLCEKEAPGTSKETAFLALEVGPMVGSFTFQLDWPTGCPGIWLDIFPGCVCEGVSDLNR